MFRTAKPEDAEQAIQVIRQSIEELCFADHRRDQDILRMWLSNKTPDNFRSWTTSPDQILLVAERDGEICCVGGVARDGEITLNYVSPKVRFQGISRAMVDALERVLLDLGRTRIRLVSTNTALRFYHSIGYRDFGPPEFWGQLPGYPMEKELA
ncbi:GNAT family N-acetyltransferase [Rhizobium sp. R693]|uniref:GNAT family N-acetyltransferase n=1 Tax=Rhizobium sp. R693 TaxID=1764276 RepID=UPI001FD8A603|nr:GNAT family N-acetyltransferase [Rhizobium sp. R693]